MSVQLVLQVVSTLTLVVALVFGALQVVYLRRARRDQAAVEIIHSMSAGNFADAWRAVLTLPAGCAGKELMSRGKATAEAADNIGLTFETLGYMGGQPSSQPASFDKQRRWLGSLV